MSLKLSHIWLSRCRGVGPVTAAELLRELKTADAVYDAGRKELIGACPKLRENAVKSLCDKRLDESEKIMEQCLKKDIRVIGLGDREYPSLLSEINDPPVVLYVRGHLPDFDAAPGIAVVGTRNATAYGSTVACNIGTTLADAGLITVSGMAHGIDCNAHWGALYAGGITVAALAGGADVCYPRDHRDLMEEIMRTGAIVSEYPPGTEPAGRNYHQRNRIISGMCVASVIVEAKDQASGSLITARHAVDQGRDVYAVPGSWYMAASQGCNQLIEKCEATLLTGPEVLVENYVKKKPGNKGSEHQEDGNDTQLHLDEPKYSQDEEPAKTIAAGKALSAPEKKQSAPSANAAAGIADILEKMSEDEQCIIKLVGEGVKSVDDIIDSCGLSASRTMSLVTMLEVKGILSQERGELVLRNL